jgi:aromatic-L-amino-acid decarboxylase
MDIVRRAFSLTPAYLRSSAAGSAMNLMDTGLQLGRRFRALKLWMVFRSYGVRAIRAHLANHIALARTFAAWIDSHPDFERLAPVPFSVVCFRWRPRRFDEQEIDPANQALVDAVNSSGEVFLSTTRIDDRLALRVAIGHLRTTDTHLRQAWRLLQHHATMLEATFSTP